MTTSEKIALELRRPSGDDVYVTEWIDVASRDEGYDEPEAELDPVSRLTRGAVFQDFRLQNQSARAIVRQFQNSQPFEQRQLMGTIVQGLKLENAFVVAALVIELGLALSLSGIFSFDDRAMFSSYLVEVLRRRPRASTDAELQQLLTWAQICLNLSKVEAEKARVSGKPWNGADRNRPFLLLVDAIEDVQRFRHRREVLHGEPPTLDRDRRELVDRLEKLGVTEDVRALLDMADRTASAGDYPGSLVKLRTFMERAFETCCRRHATAGALDVKLPVGGGAVGEWLKWAKSEGLITQAESNVVSAIASFLSMEGAHSPTSEPRQYSVAKVSVIEWCLLLAERVG